MSSDAQPCACGCGQEAVRWRLSEPCMHLLAGPCLGKVRWRTQERALEHVQGGASGVYRCPICATWHVGSRGGATPEIIARRAAVIAGLRRNGNGWILTVLAENLGRLNRHEWKKGRVTL